MTIIMHAPVGHTEAVAAPDAAGRPPHVSDERWAAVAVCPDWCEGNHSPEDPQNVRDHASAWTETVLFEDGGVSHNDNDHCTLVTQLISNWDTQQPLIQLDSDSNRSFVELTASEAESLALDLLRFVKAARKTSRGQKPTVVVRDEHLGYYVDHEHDATG